MVVQGLRRRPDGGVFRAGSKLGRLVEHAPVVAANEGQNQGIEGIVPGKISGK